MPRMVHSAGIDIERDAPDFSLGECRLMMKWSRFHDFVVWNRL